jgi:hypothetical protein
VIATFRLRLGVLIGAVVLMLVLAPLAGAVFSALKTAGPMTLVAGTLGASGTPSAGQVNCRTNKSPEIKLEWTASSSSYATSYAIERRTGSSGSYEAVAGVATSQTSYTDKSSTLEESTTYDYRIATIYHSWSAASGAVSVKTLSKFCA